MKIYVKPDPKLSRAMTRVATALTARPGHGMNIVDDPKTAHIKVVHVVGDGKAAMEHAGHPKNYMVIQYCVASANARIEDLKKLWAGSRGVWSYYDLSDMMPEGVPFYHAPLGVDIEFTLPFAEEARDIDVMTSGYVSGRTAEAIEEVAMAAHRSEKSVIHLGPDNVVGMSSDHGDWHATMGISDSELATLYRRTKWVSGLRFIEGFELPVIEGLCCGARPIVFDRPETRKWFEGHAVFIPELYGGDLVDCLSELFSNDPDPVTIEERNDVIKKFNWDMIVPGFWEKTMSGNQIDELRTLFNSKWQTDKLITEDAKTFQEVITALPGKDSIAEEALDSAEGQRDMTVRFAWGHNHNFGDFRMVGRMGDRHIRMVAAAINHGVLDKDMSGKKVLDVGCWTGGTSLMLKALGADVVAVEEAHKYANVVNYMATAFDVEGLKALPASFYQVWDNPDFQDEFDVVFIPGVLYHVTDLIVFLRIAFNALKDGGKIFIETEDHFTTEHTLLYEGATKFRNGTKEDLNRSGWNWFLPSPSVLKQLFEDVGFVDVKVTASGPRALATARRDKHVDMLRAGLSFRDIR